MTRSKLYERFVWTEIFQFLGPIDLDIEAFKKSLQKILTFLPEGSPVSKKIMSLLLIDHVTPLKRLFQKILTFLPMSKTIQSYL